MNRRKFIKSCGIALGSLPFIGKQFAGLVTKESKLYEGVLLEIPKKYTLTEYARRKRNVAWQGSNDVCFSEPQVVDYLQTEGLRIVFTDKLKYRYLRFVPTDPDFYESFYFGGDSGSKDGLSLLSRHDIMDFGDSYKNVNFFFFSGQSLG